MDKRLHLLETFKATGSDGQTYVVHGYEHLVHLDGTPDTSAFWQPTGVAEYRLATGETITVHANGTMELPDKRLQLQRQDAAAQP